MHRYLKAARRLYRFEIFVLDRLRDVLFLVIRLYFGYKLIVSGLAKLQHPDDAITAFRGWDIPYPELNVYMAGAAELFGGLFLALGLASRIATIPVIVTMLVAYMTAHTDQWDAFWTNTPIFFKAPPFAYLFTAVIVFVCGPGRLSLDYALGWFLDRTEWPTPDTPHAPSR